MVVVQDQVCTSVVYVLEKVTRVTMVSVCGSTPDAWEMVNKRPKLGPHEVASAACQYADMLDSM